MPDMIVASTTATQEEMDHAVSSNWREPFQAKPAEVPATQPATEVAIPEATEETETPAATEETQEAETAAVTEAAEVQEEVEEDEKPKFKGGFQKKIDKLTRRNGQLEDALAQYDERFKAIEERLAGKPAATTAKPDTESTAGDKNKPTPDQIGTVYKDYEEFTEALAAFKADELIERKLAARDKEANEQSEKAVREERVGNYRQAAKDFEKQTPDFNEVITQAAEAGMKLPEPLVDAIQELENGPAVIYHLAKNPDEALALIEADAATGFISLGRISQGLLAAKPVPAAPKPPAKKPISSAPPPAKPVGGNSARSATSLQDISTSSTDEYVKTRLKQIADKEAARRY